MDRVTSIDQLKYHSAFDDNMLQILNAVQSEVNEIEIDVTSIPKCIIELIDILVPFNCDDKIRPVKTKESNPRRMIIDTERLTERPTMDRILEKVLIILLKLIFKSDVAGLMIIEKIVNHMENHILCVNIHYLLLKLVLLSDQVKGIIKELDSVSILVSYLESTLSQPESPVSDQPTGLNFSWVEKPQPGAAASHERKNSEFLPLAGSPVPPDGSRIINKSMLIENESFIGELPMLHGHTVSSRELRRNLFKRKMEDSRPRSPVVPILNIPQESNRSNKKWEMQKSVSYRSGRVSALSGSWGENIFSPMSPYGKETPKPSAQMFDFDNSFIAEDPASYNEVLPSSKIMKDLALQLGEACLTADLTALIAQKRDSDLEKRAKQTAFPGPALEKLKHKGKKKPKAKKKNLRTCSLTSLHSPLEASNPEIYSTNEDLDKRSKVITLQLSLLYHSLSLYEPNELQFVRHPGNLLLGHLLSKDFSRIIANYTANAQEKFECSDDEKDLYEEELCCTGEFKEDTLVDDLQTLRFIKEEAQALPTNTVPGSPRGVKAQRPSGEVSMYIDDMEEDWAFENELNELGIAFFKLKSKQIEDFVFPQHIAIFLLLHLFGQYTESIHRQAVTPCLPPPMPCNSSSQLYDMLSPKKAKSRSPNISISMLNEEPKDNFMWINGISCKDYMYKDRLRKKSDIFMFRLSRRLAWIQETYSGPQLFMMETHLLQVFGRYLRLGRSRVSFFQAIDLMFESLINTKKRIMESVELQGTGETPLRQLGSAFLEVITQFLLQCQTIEAYKLLCEVFVGNNPWCECVKVLCHKVMGDTVRNEARPVLKYFNSTAIFCRRIVIEMKLDSKNNEIGSNEKNWKENVRKILGGMNWLVTPMVGLVPRFLHKWSPEDKPLDSSTNSVPRNLHIIRAGLELLINMYWFSSRFTVLRNEKSALFYIRMHYISFLKLYTYNKPQVKENKLTLNATAGLHTSHSTVTEPSYSTAYSKACLGLCKMHLKCLFAYARNRTPDVTRKFFQFRIIEFLTREIDLEYDITLSIERFKKVHKAEKQRVTRKLQGKFSNDNVEEPVKKLQGESLPMPIGKKIGGFSLNLANLPKKEGQEAPFDLGKDKKSDIPLLKISEKALVTMALPKIEVPLLKVSGKSDIPLLKITPKGEPIEAKVQEKILKLEEFSPPPVKKPSIPALKIGFLTQDPEKKENEKKEFEKTIIQEDKKAFELTRIQNNLDNKTKTQLFTDTNGKNAELFANTPFLDPNRGQNNDNFLESQEILKEKEFYDEQRSHREIYSDEELQTYILGLIFCLLLTPTRGTLEELYCSQYPINNGKPNVLFLLHYHLNHPANRSVLPKLQKLVGHITPPLAGLRLLKLLSATFFDSSMYMGWKKIATGAYGTVYECETGLAEPEKVAIKKMSVPKSIYDRCVLHDIFTEIASLEEFRLERCVTDLYDYGLDENDYYIVMKRYPICLKEWREKQQGSLEEILPRCLTIYKEVLKAMQIIHNHNVSHYDIKCDNVLLDDPIEDCQVTIGDFGESRMFVNSEDEVCMRNKGTEYIKSPEMLLITVAAKKEHDKYDRRRKVGTTRASDIWSLGCLLYELLTGEFLFYEADWVHFYIRCTSINEELLTEGRIDKLHQNTYLIDFLKYMLVRDPRHRPTIDKALKRFEHLHALLVNAPPAPYRPPSSYQISSLSEFEKTVQECQASMICKSSNFKQLRPSPSLLKITHDVYLCSSIFLKENLTWLVNLGITHMVYSEVDESLLKRFQNVKIGQNPLQSLAWVMDFLRSAHVTKGRILFVENNSSNIRECLLLCLSEIFLTSFYETWSLVNSQVLFMNIPVESLRTYSQYTQMQSKIKQYLALFPKYQCLCGSCSIILHRKKADPKNQVIRQCSCAWQYRNVDTSDCPSSGCGDFLNVLKDMHNISWPHLIWGFACKEDLLYCLSSQNKNEEQVLLCSMNLENNSEIVRYIEKRPWRSGADQWGLYKCKVCHMWIYAVANDDSKVAYLMNINTTGIPPGIMSGGSKLSVPVLSKIQLPLVMVQKGNDMVKPPITVNAFAPINKPNSGRLLT